MPHSRGTDGAVDHRSAWTRRTVVRCDQPMHSLNRCHVLIQGARRSILPIGGTKRQKRAWSQSTATRTCSLSGQRAGVRGRQRPDVTGMIGIFDPVRFDAFAALLARPDPRDLPRRAHVFSARTRSEPPLDAPSGDPHGLAAAAPSGDRRGEPLASTTRTWKRRGRSENPGLRVLRPTGTG